MPAAQPTRTYQDPESHTAIFSFLNTPFRTAQRFL